MQIILDETRKDGVLIDSRGKEVSRYSYSNLLDDTFTFEDFKKEIESFNNTLGLSDDFDNIKEMSKYIKIHNW